MLCGDLYGFKEARVPGQALGYKHEDGNATRARASAVNVERRERRGMMSDYRRPGHYLVCCHMQHETAHVFHCLVSCEPVEFSIRDSYSGLDSVESLHDGGGLSGFVWNDIRFSTSQQDCSATGSKLATQLLGVR